MIPVPEEIPEYVKSQEELEQEAAAVQSAMEGVVEDSSPPMILSCKPRMEEKEALRQKKTYLPPPAKKQNRTLRLNMPEKKTERDEQIRQAEAENERRKTECENLSGTISRLVRELNGKLSVIAFEEHDRWADKWNPSPTPLKRVRSSRQPNSNPTRFYFRPVKRLKDAGPSRIPMRGELGQNIIPLKALGWKVSENLFPPRSLAIAIWQ